MPTAASLSIQFSVQWAHALCSARASSNLAFVGEWLARHCKANLRCELRSSRGRQYPIYRWTAAVRSLQDYSRDCRFAGGNRIGSDTLGLHFWIGLLVAGTSMAGDLFSSFLKRRIGLGPSSKATGLDQLPESLFPLLACQPLLSLTAVDIAVGCAVFFAGAVLLSRLFFWLGLRDRPY